MQMHMQPGLTCKCHRESKVTCEVQYELTWFVARCQTPSERQRAPHAEDLPAMHQPHALCCTGGTLIACAYSTPCASCQNTIAHPRRPIHMYSKG